MEIDKAELPCSDKIAFDTRREANAAANVAEYQYGNKLRSYRCRHCDLWHLASNM